MVRRDRLLALAALAVTLRSRGARAQSAADAPGDAADVAQDVEVHGHGGSSQRGIGDVRLTREVLDASPRQQTSEMLSAAPGFFVDHEDGEGLGNDVFLRGFDLDHGSGIELRVGPVPINIPNHIQGQGYADASFIIPEVVRSVHVLEGPYDPRQGDAAIVGSATFDLGVPERGYQVRTTYGSFNQLRLVAIAAPKGEDVDEQTFAAFSLRHSDGFGQNRASQSGSANAQYAFDVGARGRVRFLVTAYEARSSLAGVVRQDDVDAGRVGYYDSYPSGAGFYAGGQGVQSSRAIFGASFDHSAPGGGHFELAPWCMWTDFRARQNFTGNLESSQIDPTRAGLGDLFETTNQEAAAGVTLRYRTARVRLGELGDVAIEPGVVARAGHTFQTKSLLEPTSLQTWDRRIDDRLATFDGAAYVDLDLRLFEHLRLSGGVRADLLLVSVDNRLAGLLPGSAPRTLDVGGVAVGPRVTAEYELTPRASPLAISPVASYGEGFRSLDAGSLAASRQDGSAPYSKVRSVEAGLRAEALRGRYTATVAAFETWVENELVFEAAAGGFETESASTRRGVVASVLARPWSWLLASAALSVTDAVFTTLAPGVSHYVPNVPPVLFRADATVRGRIAELGGRPVAGRVGVGYTYLAGRHLTDAITGPTTNALNAGGALRYGMVEVGVDAYNVLDLKYADDAEVYVSNWGVRPGQPPASVATHIVAAPPAAVVGTVSLYF
jgi:iron complex outermembrane receptor protein